MKTNYQQILTTGHLFIRGRFKTSSFSVHLIFAIFSQKRLPKSENTSRNLFIRTIIFIILTHLNKTWLLAVNYANVKSLTQKEPLSFKNDKSIFTYRLFTLHDIQPLRPVFIGLRLHCEVNLAPEKVCHNRKQPGNNSRIEKTATNFSAL